MHFGTIIFSTLLPFVYAEKPSTLLSTREYDGAKLANALENPLYEELLHRTTFVEEKSSEAGRPEESLRGRRLQHDSTHIWFDRNEISFGDSVKIHWQNAEDDDVITMHCPGDGGHTTIREATQIGSIKQQGINKMYWIINSFPIIRENTCDFRLWKRSNQNVLNLSSHAVLVLRYGKATPTGIHLSHTTEPTSMRVHFTTGEAGTPFVNFGVGHNLDLFQEGTSQTYSASDLCHAPANITAPGKFSSPGMLHTVMLQDLIPNTKYSYQVGVRSSKSEDIIWSKSHSFTTSPPVGSFPISTLVIADQGCPEAEYPGAPSRDWRAGADEVVAQMSSENNIQSIHIVGDLSYAIGAAHVWDAWLEMIQPYATRVPVMVSIGNHDYNYHRGVGGNDPTGENGPYIVTWGTFSNGKGECGVPVAARFHGSGNGNNVFWHSYDLGGVHFVTIMSEQDLSPGSRQYAWLEQDLKSIDRKITPWVIVESHRPLYNSLHKTKSNVVDEHIREKIEDLLYEYDVDVLIGGHYHAYLRTCNGLYKSKCNNGGTTYITIGTGGGPIKKLGIMKQDWTEKVLFEYGYGRVTAWSETEIHFEFLGVDGNVKDDVWIRK